MPKRIVDGEALWQSDKLGEVEPVRFRAEFANLLPLALANGSFECNARAIWAKVYATNRPDITVDDVHQILDEFERVRMLFRWEDKGKTWGYWAGIDKAGRLPSSSILRKKHYALGAQVPENELHRFISGDVTTMSRQCSDNVLDGIGIGTGIGKTNTSTPIAAFAAHRSPAPSAEKRAELAGLGDCVFVRSLDGKEINMDSLSPRHAVTAELKRVRARAKRPKSASASVGLAEYVEGQSNEFRRGQDEKGA